MPQVDVPVDKGENSVMDEKRLPPGFAKLLDGWMYMPDDPDRLHKIPGRSEAAELPSGVTAANVKGLVHLQYDNGTNVIVLLGNSTLYEATDGDTLGAWSEVQDLEGTAFQLTGDFLRAVADGANRWILWSGTEDERALVRDEDGNWRLLGMLQPGQPTLTEVIIGAAAPEVVQPDTYELAPVGVYETDPTDRRFTDEANAVDDGDDKYETIAYDTTLMRHDGKGQRHIIGTRFGFSGQLGADPAAAGYQVVITLDLSVGTAGDPQPLPLGEGRELGFDGQFSIELYDEAVSTVTPAHKTQLLASYISYNRSDENNGVQVTFELDALSGDLAWADLKLDVKWHYTRGSTQVTAQIRDIRFIKGGILTQDTVEAGTYEYAITEVHQITLASGESFITESAPSARLSVAVTGATADAIDLVMPTALSNLPSAGYAQVNMSYNVYRSTKTGAWPNLGLIATVSADSSVFRDTFKVGSSTLGVPSLRVVSVGGVFHPQAGMPPAIWDAVLFRGVLVIVPAGVRRSLQWSLANQPDAVPFPHDLRTLPSDRNDALVAVEALGDALLIALRTKVVRIQFLPSSDTAVGFDLSTIEVDDLSPDEGLAGGPRVMVKTKTEHGRGLTFWTSDNGVWMTDGSLAQERGLGVRKVSRHVAWRKIVDVSALGSAVMTYDPVLQVVYLDLDDRDGNRLTFLIHVSPSHWVGEGENAVPKFTRTTMLVAVDRTVGENSGELKHWSLDTSAATPKVLLERSGTTNDGATIRSYGRMGWFYPASPFNGVEVWEGLLAHEDWGLRDMLDMEVYTRRDETGIEQLRRTWLPLRGSRTDKWLVALSGQAVSLGFAHTGPTVSDGSELRAVGPFALTFDAEGDIQDD